jgi:predicted Zn-dependent protease
VTIRAKSRRRILALLLGAVAVVGVATFLYRRRERRLDDAAWAAREQALAAFSEGDYALAVSRFAHFLRRLEPDALVLLRYAQAILRQPSPDEEHATAAVASLRHAVELDPESGEARRLLLDAYLATHARTEALEQAEWLLRRDSGDERALLAKARLLEQMRRVEDAVRTLEGRRASAPLSLEAELLRLRLESRLGADARALVAQARAVEASHPAEPRFGFVVARALLLADDVPGARERLRALVPIARQDAAFAALLVGDLEAAGLSRDALATLESLPDASLVETGLDGHLALRLWQAGRTADVRTRVLSPGTPLARRSTAVVAHLALASESEGDADGAQRALAILAGRTAPDARGWTRLLRDVVLPESPSVASRIAGSLAAVEADARNAQSRHELASAYVAAGEPDLALRAWIEAARLDRVWPAPAVAAANLLATEGRLREAMAAAAAAGARASDDPGVEALLHLSRAASGERPGPTLFARVLSGLPDGASGAAAPFRLAVFAAAGRTEETRSLLEEVIAGTFSAEVLLACAEWSRAQGLGFEDRLLARCEELHGSTPALAQRLAARKAEEAGTEAGLVLLRRRAVEADATSRAEWLLAEARYLESRRDATGAANAWRRLAADPPRDPLMLLALLDADAVWTDVAAAGRLLERLRRETHDTCLRWRHHEARRLLSAAAPSRADADAAAAHLQAVLSAAPHEARSRVLLARAHETAGRSREALEQLSIVRGRPGSAPAPGAVALDLEIARLSAAVGDVVPGLQAVRRATAAASEPDHLLGAALLFVRLGHPDEAVGALDRLGRTDDPDLALRRAEAYAAAGEPRRAEELARALVEGSPSPRALLFAAGLAQASGRREESAAILARLSAAIADPLERERALARHHRRTGDLAAAERHLVAAAALPGAAPADALALAASRVLQGRLDEAALASNAGDGVDERLVRAAAAHEDLRPLAATLVEEPRRRAALDPALRILVAARASRPTAADLARLRAATESAPDHLALQVASAELLLRERAADDAVAVAQAALVRFPTSPEPARLLAYAHRAAGRPDRAADAAREWASRLPGSRVAPDLFLAEQSAPPEALAYLDPHLPTALDRRLPSVVLAWGRASIGAGAPERVRETLEPRLAASPWLADVWVVLAGVAAGAGHAGPARAWLEHPDLRPALAESARVQVEAAASWQALARATSSADARERSRALAAEASGRSLDAPDAEGLGAVHEANGDVDRAEAAYRAAIAADPGRLLAANNLAMILARSGRAEEAFPLGLRLVESRPDVASFLDTLAFVQEKRGDLAEAERLRERSVEREPGNPVWAHRLVRLLQRRGDLERAVRRFEALRVRHPLSSLPPDLRSEWSELARSLGAGREPPR